MRNNGGPRRPPEFEQAAPPVSLLALVGEEGAAEDGAGLVALV